MNTQTKELEKQITELRQQIEEFEEWGHHNVAKMFRQELETLIATHRLGTGVKTASQLRSEIK